MDPDVTLATFMASVNEAVAADDDVVYVDRLEEAVEAATILFEWLAQSGFAPTWSVFKSNWEVEK